MAISTEVNRENGFTIMTHPEAIKTISEGECYSKLVENLYDKFDGVLKFKLTLEEVFYANAQLDVELKTLKKKISLIQLSNPPELVEENRSEFLLFKLASKITEMLGRKEIQNCDKLQESLAKTLHICLKTLRCFGDLYPCSKFGDQKIYNKQLTDMEETIVRVHSKLPKNQKLTKQKFEVILHTIAHMREGYAGEPAIALRSPNKTDPFDTLCKMLNAPDKKTCMQNIINLLKEMSPKEDKEECQEATSSINEWTQNKWEKTAFLYLLKYPCEGRKAVFEKIKEVIYKEEFQCDPGEYIDAWVKKRGPEMMYIYVEDDALKFLKLLLNAEGLRNYYCR